MNTHSDRFCTDLHKRFIEFNEEISVDKQDFDTEVNISYSDEWYKLFVDNITAT